MNSYLEQIFRTHIHTYTHTEICMYIYTYTNKCKHEGEESIGDIISLLFDRKKSISCIINKFKKINKLQKIIHTIN